MLRCLSTRILSLIAGTTLVFLAQPARAGFGLLNENVKVDQATQQVVFNLMFNRAPDFSRVDADNRPADAFQIEIVPNVSKSIDQYGFDAIRAVVRGAEIGHGTSVPIRDGFEHGSDGNPASGGWGSILATVPFSLHGNEMTFSTPFSLIGTTNGNFAFRIFTTNYGATISESQGVSVPLPAALPATLLTFALFAAAVVGRRAIRGA